ncbi:hypothetical protein [Roseiterribacter gracilis]|uniref:Uncharacterized protein n=1 Tax=Roseiterribacter gracilis TaxID=2812848 RepID=A0A8S8X8A3_9PROT|nr:hypothetical protein TMPK1_02680 [Rhodospirillales bacterium TMPK1]
MDDLLADLSAQFRRRKFSAGVLVALIDMVDALGLPSSEIQDLDAFFAHYPRQTKTGEKVLNTLIVATGNGNTLSLRGFYDAAERLFRAEHHRFDYPSCAPHATQAWQDYLPWLAQLIVMTHAQRALLREDVVNFVLRALPSQAFDPSTIRVEPPLFRDILAEFELVGAGEPSGAVFQGIVFGFLRADNPHLQIEIEKVRTGSKRLQRVGDVDGWEGERLALSAEVKQFPFEESDVADVAAFANATGQRGTLAIVAALTFTSNARINLSNLGVKPLDRKDLLRIVELWDPIKQRIAVTSFQYYAAHVEKNSKLRDRIREFVESRTA